MLYKVEVVNVVKLLREKLKVLVKINVKTNEKPSVNVRDLKKVKVL